MSGVSGNRPNLAGKVAVVSHSHPSVTKGGAEIAAYTLYQGLLELGTDAIFIAACPEDDRSRVSLGSSREHVIFYQPVHYDHYYHLSHFDTVNRLGELLVRENVSLVNFHHFFNFGVGVLRRAAAIPSMKVVITLHEFLAICNHHGQMVTRPALHLCERATSSACATCFPERTRQQFSLRKMSLLAALSSCDACVSPSNFLGERFVEWGLDPGRMSVIENGLRNLPPRKDKLANDQPKSQWTFGFFGQINPFKGVDLLLRAASILSKDEEEESHIQIRLHGNLIGQSEDFLKQFEKQTQGDNSNIAWLGPYDNTSVGQLMGECDYVLVPSKWWENSPVVIQEAFAVGCPVICSGIGGMAEKVRHGVSGLHFRVNDQFDLVRVLKEAAKTSRYKELFAGIPLPYGGKEMARRYLNLFSKLDGKSASDAAEDLEFGNYTQKGRADSRFEVVDAE
jgi:glycosyltransferase involved in cell wall biosynthesis